MRFLSNTTLLDVLKLATKEELVSLTSLIEERKVENPSEIKVIRDEISSMGGHSFTNILRLGEGTGYLDILDDIAAELNIKGIPSYNCEVKYFDELDNLKYSREESLELGIKYTKNVEEKIILKILELSYEKMSKEEKKSFDEQINEIANKFDSNSKTYLTGGAGLIALGNLGGFATYTFLTTSLSTLSIGTLGFATYTGATSLLSVLLGPIGWASLGAIAVLTLGSPNTKKLIPIVATIGAIRQRIEYEKENI